MHKVFVSFDFENDRHYKFLLEAWHAHPDFQFSFEDGTPREIDSNNVGRVKAALTTKIKNATHTLVIVGEHANDPHPNRALIGYKNWINFEIAQSIAQGKRIAVLKLDRSYESPEELKNATPSWVYSYTVENVVKVLNEAPYPVRRYS